MENEQRRREGERGRGRAFQTGRTGLGEAVELASHTVEKRETQIVFFSLWLYSIQKKKLVFLIRFRRRTSRKTAEEEV